MTGVQVGPRVLSDVREEADDQYDLQGNQYYPH